jgi:Fe-S cluster assembly protein SufD
MSAITSDRHPFLAGFAGLERELERRDPAWLVELRRASLARFEALGFPSTRLEAWKQTSVAAIAGARFRPAEPGPAPSLDGLPLAAPHGDGRLRLVFVDGRLDRGASTTGGLPPGLGLGGLAATLAADPTALASLLGARTPAEAPAFRALNGALFEDGAVVRLDDGVELAEPIELLFVSRGTTGAASHPRTLIVAGRRSRARVIETFLGLGDGSYLTNAVTETVLGDGASVDHWRLQLEGPAAFHIADVHSRQGRDSRYRQCSVQLGARLARHDVTALLDGEGGWCRLDGLVLAHGEQHHDNHTLIDHARGRCDSRELYKCVLGGASRTVFHGRIVVRPDAQRTDAKQSNPNLLLSGAALAHTRPQLEIYADDVKCTHGATIGRLDEDSVFYLRSRGVAEGEARRLLVAAFAGEVLEPIEPELLRSRLAQAVSARLAEAGGG